MVQQEQALPHRPEPSIPEQWNGTPGGSGGSGGRLRVDARRNLESVLRAAREVFGELGYGAPMEEVARRAGVGVGTVYRRFPSKEVLVRRIAAEEVTWLTVQARESLEGDAAPWDALAGYLTRAVSSGAGRLLPPEAFRHAERMERIPVQRKAGAVPTLEIAAPPTGEGGGDADPVGLLELLAQLVEQARSAGGLRDGVTVSDVVLVLTASVPSYTAPSAAATGSGEAPAQGSSTRLLRILLDGLRAV